MTKQSVSSATQTLRQRVFELLSNALIQFTNSIEDDLVVAQVNALTPHIERTRDSKFGDFASNIAMQLTKILQQNPRAIAEQIISNIPENNLIAETSIAGPGFINFGLIPEIYYQELQLINSSQDAYGIKESNGQKVLVEFVSANPTGPLHVGHGRHAAYGASVSNLLEANGYKVHREYYVNDAGRQMQILGVSTWLRYLEILGIEFDFPVNAYKGDYIKDIAQELSTENSDKYITDANSLFTSIPPDEPQGGDKDTHIDALAKRCKEIIGNDGFEYILDSALNSILTDIKNDLKEFGVVHDEWFSEKRLVKEDLIQHAIDKLESNGTIYEKDGAKWFKATDYHDDKDRVVVRANGVTTYFASDIAYHLSKRERGNDILLDILGSDHHGYQARLRGVLEAMGEPPECLEVRLMQFANLYRGKVKVQMSTRSGSFVSLRELRDEVGNDAARLFYVMRSNEQHLDFDLELAKKRDNENPVYYLQYAHARICSVFAQVSERNITFNFSDSGNNLSLLAEPQELELLRTLSRYPEILESCANNRAPHVLVQYLRELANEFHSYYNAHKVLVDEIEIRDARLYLYRATQQVLQNGFAIIGISSPEKM